MRTISILIWAGIFMASSALAQFPVSVTINTRSHGPEIPADFAGVSIFTGTQTRDHGGVAGNLFSGTNSQLITLFRNSGIHHLRLGATGSSSSGMKNLNHEDIDSLFAFARGAGIRVIYSLHAADGPATAKYVWDHYRSNLDCLAFDNEPDQRVEHGEPNEVTNHVEFLSDWKQFTKSVRAVVPGAKFAGPDAAGRTLVRVFVKDERKSGLLALVTQHIYVGGNPIKRHVDAPAAIDNMLSPEWVTNRYPRLYDSVLRPVAAEGFPFRLTESDDYTKGVTNASDTFAAALWALDYLHWWAAHGAAGVNFQNTEWLRTDTFHRDAFGNYQIYPKAYGIRAFDLGSHGKVEPVTIANTGGLNLTAYAVRNGRNHYITLINKEHGASARAAAVTILGLSPASADLMILAASGGDVGTTNGVTLGGGQIVNNAEWHGQWTEVSSSAKARLVVTVPAASAAIVRIVAR